MNYTKFVIISLRLSFILSVFLMNCLHLDPNLLKRKIDPKLRDYDYACLNLLKSYEIPIEIYYNYFLSIEEFKLKNIWNNLAKRWNKMNLDLKENQDFIDSDHSHKEYHQIHTNMNDSELDLLISNFIDENYMKCFFVSNVVQSCIILK